MAMRRMVLRADIGAAETDDRSVTVTCSTETLGRDDIILVSGGIELDAYRNNPVWLWQHNPDWPIARAEQIDVTDGKLVARVRFPEAGVSARADEILGLIRAGVVNAASTGFDSLEAEPIDPAKPRSGTKIVRCELHEMSFVSIPAVPDALITSRSAGQKEIETMVDEAIQRRVEHDADVARVERMKRGMVKRGLYEVGHLASLLAELGWVKDSSEWEASVENDGSDVPAQLGAALKALGDVLISMTTEEVGELVGGGEAPEGDDASEVEIITQSKNPGIARYRLGVHRARMPKVKAPPVARSASFHARMAAMYVKELAPAG